MKTKIQHYSAILLTITMLLQIVLTGHTFAASNDTLMYPLKQISKIDCRFEDFDSLSSSCKQNLPILKTKDYEKYASKNGWYNDYTRIYTVLWGSSYKYGWDVGHGGHQGTDIATAKGTPVYAIADGKVIESGSDLSWGKHISIEHTIRGKKVVSNYAHLSKLLVKKWDTIKMWKNIGEVGSTGNSTGNHLHFQIDLPATFHPYYYDWNACPYSYYEITEKWVCFDELTKHTFDPFAFLESNGAVLDQVTTTQNTYSPKKNTTSIASQIFSTTVSPENGTKAEIKEVQKIYRDLGYYDGKISGKYSDLENALIDYQVKSWVISSRDADGAGWFGPKTRKQTQKDYNAFLAKNDNKTPKQEDEKQVVWVVKTPSVKKVSRKNLLTREEIEAKEVQDFLKKYSIKFQTAITHVDENKTKTTVIEVKNAKGKGFKWNTPGKLSFSFDESKISVFPTSFYNFTNGERDIHITGKKVWHTTLSVKIGDVIVKTFSITVGTPGKDQSVESSYIYTDSQAVLWDNNTAIVVMKDSYGNKLVRTKFSGTFQIESDDNVLYCIKRGSIADIKSLYSRDCYDQEYTDSLQFTYQDTIWGLLLFDYKVLDTNKVHLKVTPTFKKSVLAQTTIKTQIPKGLNKNYEYFDEVIASLSSGISNGIRNDYFREEMPLSQLDAKRWIRNTLIVQWKDNTNNLKQLQKEPASKTKNMTRKDFLTLSYKYLWEEESVYQTRVYKDMSDPWETMVASLLGTQYSWKDKFWEKYFQPNKEITRGEATYMLSELLKENGHNFVAKK